MPLDSYSALKTAISGFLHRSDLAAQIPDFIRLAEAQINRRLKVRPKEVEVPLSAIVGSRFVVLPLDFGSPIGLYSDTTEPRVEFVAVPAASLPVDENNRRLPTYWAIDGANLAFEAPADQAYPLKLRYLKSIYLSDAAPTHDLFARAPDLYLYGALEHSAPYMMDDARMPMWQAKFRSLLAAVAAEGARDTGMATLQTEIPAVMPGGACYGRGWGY